jgi:DNA-binding transcriptional regulator GbsR (MarR family)
MIAHGPLSAEEIASLLKVSRGSISTNMRLLIGSGLVEKTSLSGERMTFFIFPETGLEQRFVVGIHSAKAFKKLSEQGLAALSSEDHARHNLQDAIELSDLMIEVFQDAIVEWQTRKNSVSEKKQLVYKPTGI